MNLEKTKSSKSRRSARGKGCLRKIRCKGGGERWVAITSFVDWQGKRHRPQITAPTRERALALQKFLDERRNEKGKTQGVHVTVSQLAGQWLHQLNCESGTRKQREISLRKHILPYLGRRRVIEMEPDLLDQWRTLLRDSECGASALCGAWSTLRCLLKHAMTIRVLRTHPMYGLVPPRRQPKEIVPFSDDELAKIWEELQGCRELELLQAIYSLGLRQGEAYGLKWTDLTVFDVADDQGAWGELEIRRQVLDEGEQIIKEKTKTKSGRRTLALTSEHLVIFESRRLKAEEEGLQTCEWIFPSAQGKPVRRGNLRTRIWNPLLRRLGIAHRGLHHFRHTAITNMLEHGASLLDVAGTAGHSKPETTVRIYSHIIAKRQGSPLSFLSAKTVASQQQQAARRQFGRVSGEGGLDTEAGDS